MPATRTKYIPQRLPENHGRSRFHVHVVFCTFGREYRKKLYIFHPFVNLREAGAATHGHQ